jgi:hypothetical protein
MIVFVERDTRRGKDERKAKGVKYEWLAENEMSITRTHLLRHDRTNVGQRASGCHNTMSFDGVPLMQRQTTTIR